SGFGDGLRGHVPPEEAHSLHEAERSGKRGTDRQPPRNGGQKPVWRRESCSTLPRRDHSMGLLDPVAPPYDPLDWAKKPFAEKSQMVCRSWALQGYGTPLGVYFLYAFKLAAYVAGWWFFCRFTPGMGELATIGQWWLRPEAFQRAIVWSLLF